MLETYVILACKFYANLNVRRFSQKLMEVGPTFMWKIDIDTTLK